MANGYLQTYTSPKTGATYGLTAQGQWTQISAPKKTSVTSSSSVVQFDWSKAQPVVDWSKAKPISKTQTPSTIPQHIEKTIYSILGVDE